MIDTVITVEHLSKYYRLGQIGTGTLANSWKIWRGRIRRISFMLPKAKVSFKSEYVRRPGFRAWGIAGNDWDGDDQ